MTNEVVNVPELRFTGFEDEWKETNLGNIANIVGGGTPKTEIPEYWNGEINWYSPVEIGNRNYVYESKNKITQLGLKKSSAKILPIGTVLFTARAGIGNTAILKKEGATNQGFQSIIPKEGVLDTYFIFSRTNELKRYGEIHGAGSTFVEISGKEMAKMPISIPVIKEQQKIGEFFSKLDRQIELEEQKLEKLKEQKKGYMQKIFSQTLRFKDEEDNVYPDWIRTKLINIVTPLKGQDDNITNFPILTISASRGWLNQKERFSQVIAGNSLKKYTQVKKNDLSYNKGNSKVAKYGIVFRLKNEALVPNVYKSFRPNENIDSIFIEKYFHNKTLDKQLRTRITSTARTDGLLNISDQDFYDIKLYIPILQEQTKIADFLNKLDKLIEKQSSKIILLKHRKKGLLQKMFV
ncbi:restriction endonuclease subunit S [Mammaliicoccus sp. O-M53]|uniref:restriction endonuclease subunit S n=1 Tax=Mammaliicoccus sp. O-M53 TaxID=2898712 RepID=UPI001EFBE4E8|nr:restriction endonuclease subunit S [Mammaliicoccus sp. O-M53]